jgi:hypothetical protein
MPNKLVLLGHTSYGAGTRVEITTQKVTARGFDSFFGRSIDNS